MAETSIEWTSGPNGELGYTFNPVEGCQRVSPGCVNCYAERKNKWLHRGENWGPGTPRLTRSDAYWRQPLKWNADALKAGQRRKVFCASVADVFENHPGWIGPRLRLFRTIRETPQLDWLLLTKRPENFGRFLPWHEGSGPAPAESIADVIARHSPWPNVWLGTTVEDQQRANERIPHLLATPAVVRFLSVEPQLEHVDFRDCTAWNPNDDDFFLNGIDWVICGGESGPGARPFDIEWARSLRDQCTRAEVPFFMKQLGAHTRMSPDGGDPITMFFKKGQSGELDFMPPDLRLRQFPAVRHA